MSKKKKKVKRLVNARILELTIFHAKIIPSKKIYKRKRENSKEL